MSSETTYTCWDGVIVGLLIISFIGLGILIGQPRYKLPADIKTKLENDAKTNYRDETEQIAFIITGYYSDEKKQNGI